MWIFSCYRRAVLITTWRATRNIREMQLSHRHSLTLTIKARISLKAYVFFIFQPYQSKLVYRSVSP